MYICYIDESGTPDLPGNSQVYVLAAIAIPIEQWKSSERQLQEIKDNFLLSDAEIHTAWILRPYIEQSKIQSFDKLSYDSRKIEVEKYRKAELLRLQKDNNLRKHYKQTKKNFEKTKSYIHLSYDERSAFIRAIAEIVGSWTECRLFAECIDKIHFDPSLTGRDVDVQAFEQIVSRFEQYLKIISKSRKVHQYSVLVHDNNETVSKKHTDFMKSFHKSGTLWTDIQHIIETPLFVDSQLTSMVQIADLCSYALRRYLENGEEQIFSHIFKIADRKDGKLVGIRHFTGVGCNCVVCRARK